jgi:hypothetical protein
MRLGFVCLASAAVVSAAAPSLRATIEQQRGAHEGETNLIVKATPSGFLLGAYQGTVTFLPGSFTIVNATTPGSDGVRVVNAADSAKGIVRFAGYTLMGFKSNEILTLVIKPKRPLATAYLSATVTVAADLNGTAIPREQIIPARGISPSGRD